MERVKLSNKLEISRIVHGMWRLTDWNMSIEQLENFIEKVIESGVTTFDHADIYGDYTCEERFGEILERNPEFRNRIEIVTKCGIKLLSENRPEHKIKSYDTSYNHIINSVEKSLLNLKTDYIDLLLIHRPDPLMDANETAKAFNYLRESGKVIEFGVSNFNIRQFSLLQSRLDFKLVTNQVELSAAHLKHFENNNVYFFQEKDIKPMAWSPLDGGKIFKSNEEKYKRLRKILLEVANDIGEESIDVVLYAWLLNHPAKIIPIVGSGNIDRIKASIHSTKVNIGRENWFKIMEASRGREVL